MQKVILGITLFSTLLFSCKKESAENVQTSNASIVNSNDSNAEVNFNHLARPWRWHLGVSIDFARKQQDCNYGAGLCKIGLIFVEWNARNVRGNIGLDSNGTELTVVFPNVAKIDSLLNGATGLVVGSGDENIEVDDDVLQDLGVSSLSLVPGNYPLALNDSGYYEAVVSVETN